MIIVFEDLDISDSDYCGGDCQESNTVLNCLLTHLETYFAVKIEPNLSVEQKASVNDISSSLLVFDRKAREDRFSKI